MASTSRADIKAGGSGAGADGMIMPSVAGMRLLPLGLRALLSRCGWTLVSVGSFALLWELLWALGLADPKLLDMRDR